MYRIELPKRVTKQLDKISSKDYLPISRIIQNLKEIPRPVGCKKLFESLYRIRVGDFRIIYWIDDKSKEPRLQGGALKPILKPKTEIPKQVRDDKKTRTKLSCHAELVSASDLFFLLSADASFIPVHRKGFSDAILINQTLHRVRL